MKNIVVLGSTGSIGLQTLDVIRAHGDSMRVKAVCAHRNLELIRAQLAEFSPEYVGICDESAAEALCGDTHGAKLISGANAAEELCELDDVDIIVNGICGFAGLRPLLRALRRGKTVALANKESIVCAHALVDAAIANCGGTILPVDSEQSAIFQALAAGRQDEIARLVLTASGGPFRGFDRAMLKGVSVEQALAHPVWRMGKKITIDSATLFNKGLEIMEAAYLFKIGGECVDVLVHPEGIVHSMVEFVDGSNIAQLSAPDMRLAIQYALTYPNRIDGIVKPLRLEALGRLTFEKPDCEAFEAIPLAYAALKEGAVLPITYNGANEAAVERFIAGEIGFLDIARCVEFAMGHIGGAFCADTIEDIIETDREARALAGRVKARY